MKKAAPSACSGGTMTTATTTTKTTTTTTTSTTTTTTAATSCVQAWIGDGYCDAENNKAVCLFDRGDCCPPYSNTDWDWFCKGANVRFIKYSFFLDLFE